MDPRLMIGPQGPRLGGLALKKQNSATPDNSQVSFDDLLTRAITNSPTSPIKISAHAQKRLDERSIQMTPSLENSIKKALNELSAKGAKDSLVITDQGAFLVNVPSRTMVTAMGLDEMRDGIVTNIDSVSMKYK
ncbi:MAG: TIGR02530 family flagellar biosynthesis protein [Candidatus Rifleibacteriota bacterium]